MVDDEEDYDVDDDAVVDDGHSGDVKAHVHVRVVQLVQWTQDSASCEGTSSVTMSYTADSLDLH
eukprot:4336769-Amphidinium_carterae.1